MQVHGEPSDILKDVVPLGIAVSFCAMEAVRREQAAEGGQVRISDRQVEVAMGAGLLPKQCVDSPASVDPEWQAGIVEHATQPSH